MEPTVVDPLDLVVVGAGVAGLAAARLARAEGRSVLVIEGRDRVGGRLLSAAAGVGRIDLGATWFWPGERRVAALVDALGVRVHQQYRDGDAVYQRPHGVQRLDGNPIDVPSFRFTDGADSLTVALGAALPAGSIRLGESVSAVSVDGSRVTVTSDAGQRTAASVIVAVPPALAATTIEFSPGLPEPLAAALRSTPVWMGSTTKVVAVYDRAFWRDAGLSGAAVSHVGPMGEIHDMSGPAGRPAALFGFVPDGSVPSHDELLAQLAALFGPLAADPVDLHVRAWRDEAHTSPPDVEQLRSYQMFGHAAIRTAAFDGRLAFASTETGVASPGHIEGALEAAENAIAQTRQTMTADPGGFRR